MTAAPNTFPYVEDFAERVRQLKADVERHGRDPEGFEIAIAFAAIVHDDPDVFERMFANPLQRCYSATLGRVMSDDWHREGVEPLFPPGWSYAFKYVPQGLSRPEALDLAARVPRTMVERATVNGTSKEVAAAIEPYIEAGATWVTICDMAPLVLPPEELPGCLDRNLEVYRYLKA